MEQVKISKQASRYVKMIEGNVFSQITIMGIQFEAAVDNCRKELEKRIANSTDNEVLKLLNALEHIKNIQTHFSEIKEEMIKIGQDLSCIPDIVSKMLEASAIEEHFVDIMKEVRNSMEKENI